MRLVNGILATAILLSVVGCKDEIENPKQPKLELSNFKQGTALPYNVLQKFDKIEVRNGGFGSAACAHPSDETMFYALTDRGANLKYNTGSAGKGKKFPTPNYNPRIGLFKLNNDGKITLVSEVVLKNPSGSPLTGLPNPDGKGATGETPYDMEGAELTVGPNGNGTDDFGIDSEGLAAMNDGTFWISDEYGPHVAHFDASGKQLKRISPVGINGTSGTKLPAVFAKRRPNRGMEGLTVTPDQKTLVGIMQSTMDIPTKASRNNNVTRIVTIDIATGNTKQYLYAQEKNQNSNSEIAALSSTEFMVIERDGKFLRDDPAAQKHIYKINISGATNVGVSKDGKDLFNDAEGYKIDGKALEELSVSEITAAGVKFVGKEMKLDLVAKAQYPHDKLEGIWLMKNGKIGCVNDDDFAVWSEGGNLIQKKITTDGKIDGSALYIFDY